MIHSDLFNQLEKTLEDIINYLSINFQNLNVNSLDDSNSLQDELFPFSVKNEIQRQKIPKNICELDLSIFKKCKINIQEGAHFPYKTRGKRNTFVSIKVHPDLPFYISNISENHTKHAVYDTNFDINIEKADLTRIIPVIFLFDKSLQTGELELLGINYVELQKGTIKDDQFIIYQNEWVDIYSKETRKYNGSVKLTIYLDEIKPQNKEIKEEPLNNSSKKQKRIKTKRDVITEDIAIQTDEYYEEIPLEKIENKDEISFVMQPFQYELTDHFTSINWNAIFECLVNAIMIHCHALEFFV